MADVICGIHLPPVCIQRLCSSQHAKQQVLECETLFFQGFKIIVTQDLDALFGANNGLVDAFVFKGKPSEMTVVYF